MNSGRRGEAKPLGLFAAVMLTDVEESKRAIEVAAEALRRALLGVRDREAVDALGVVLVETVGRVGCFDDIWVSPEGRVFARPVKGTVDEGEKR